MPRQTNFGGGEISPLLWGRTDLPFWARSLRACLNFFISKPGAAVSRPGTTYVGEMKNSPNAEEIFTRASHLTLASSSRSTLRTTRASAWCSG